MSLHCPDSMTAVAGFFNGLCAPKLDNLGDIYSPAVEFRDPLHQVRGVSALREVYEQILKARHDFSVTVTDAHGDERTGFLLWTMHYTKGGERRSIDGTSHLKFAADGRVAAQQDHWDASFAVYGEYPLLGWLMRRIKRRIVPESGNFN
jgi:steroid delta-isomerase